LTAEIKYGGTVTNVKRKRVPGGGSNYSKTTRAEACAYRSLIALILPLIFTYIVIFSST